MLFREIIAVSYGTHRYTVGKMREFFSVKGGGACTYHCAVEG
jgi:hypothetical protein